MPGAGRLTDNEAPAASPRIGAAVAVGACVAAAMACSYAAAPGVRGLLGAALAMLMIAIAVVDARQFIIPNALVAAAFVLGLVHAGVAAPVSAADGILVALLRSAVLGLAFLALREGYRWLRGREGLGLGDVKLAAVAGLWLDWTTIPVAIQVAALTAITAYGLRQWRRGRRLQRTAVLPFGLFLAPAIWIGWGLEAMVALP